MFENPRRGRQARNFATNAPKILDLKSSSEQIFSRKLPLGAPVLASSHVAMKAFLENVFSSTKLIIITTVMITLLKYTLPHGTNLTIILIGDISVLFLAAIVASLLREARSKIVSTRIYAMQTLCS